jgi:hypothetical protein
MRRWLMSVCILIFGGVCQSFALAPAIPDAGVVVYAYRNLEAVGAALRATATQAGWHCDRPEPANALAQNNLILQCKRPTGQGFIVADDFVDPLDRASVQGYSDAENLDEMLKILREFVRRAAGIPNARILFQQFPERR